LTEETELTESDSADQEPSEEGRATAGDVAQELKEREDEIEGGEAE
jgi:hypothetical protein